MNYVYDILLNLHTNYYEFYDWNLEDKLTHIRKIPILKIDSNKLKEILYDEVQLDVTFLDKIKNHTEVFTKMNVIIFEYACLLCDERKVIGIKCDHLGHVIGKSDLLIDEHYDVMSVVDRYQNYDIKYKLIKKNDIELFKTRKEIADIFYLTKELEKQSTEKLQYLLYEYNENENNNKREDIISKLKDKILNHEYEKISTFLKLVNKQKNV